MPSKDVVKQRLPMPSRNPSILSHAVLSFKVSGPPSLFLLSKNVRQPFEQGCQMVYFQTKIPISVHFGRPWNYEFGVFSVHLEFVLPFLYFCGIVDIFFTFWFVVRSKIWQPCF
jgi:hypothetical protein